MAENQLSDKQLIERYFSGDEAAFEALLKRYLTLLYRYIVSLVKDPETAEDVVQQTAVKAWKHLRRFEPEKSFKTWFFTIGKRTAYDSLRRKRILPFSSLQEETRQLLESTPDEALLPDEILAREDIAEEVQAALAEIPLHFREVLLLVYQQGFTLGEAAQILGKSYNTVKSNHYRAIQSLRKVLQKTAPK